MTLNEPTTFTVYPTIETKIPRPIKLQCDGETLNVLSEKEGKGGFPIKVADILDVKLGKDAFLSRAKELAASANGDRCFTIQCRKLKFDLEATSAEKALEWVQGLKELTGDSGDLSEDAFSNESRARSKSEKKSGGVAAMMHGGTSMLAHFDGKPSRTVTVRITEHQYFQLLTGGKNVAVEFPLRTLSDVYVGVFTPVLKKKNLDNATAFTLISSNRETNECFTLNLSGNTPEETVKWLDGLKQALQSISNEIVTESHTLEQ